MELNEYQRLANQTDQQPEEGNLESDPRSILVPLLGMAGEVGELLGEHKKWLRGRRLVQAVSRKGQGRTRRPVVVLVQCCDQARADSGRGSGFQPQQDRQAVAACGRDNRDEKALR